jgi:hypothetical protein
MFLHRLRSLAMRFVPVLLVSTTMFATITLAACNSSQDHPAEPTAASSASAPQDTKTAATTDQFKAQVALHGTPTVSADGKFIVVTVDLSNDGYATLASTGLNPVNLGAHSIDAKGNVVRNDLARGALPDPIAPNNHALVSINLPVDKTVGYSAHILPVQENVGWFDKWGTKPLTVGPFNACSDNVQDKVCDASGKALPSQ